MNTVKIVSFSPTGTTSAVLNAIAQGMGADAAEMIDITKQEIRNRPLSVTADDLLLVGVPVYMGRVPALLGEFLNGIQAKDTPAVCVVVYGNRAFEDSLLELKDMMKGCGCVPVAGAAYIGEHSFSCADMPTAEGRPDTNDLTHAEKFGRRVREKLDSVSSFSDIPELSVPGNHPYGGRTELWDVDFIAVGDECVQCGLCADVCPVGAVDPDNSAQIDQVKCITCCACIKQCPQNARTMKEGPVMEARRRLNTLFHERREPECFL